MATKDCKSCVTLKETAPEFILNGVTDNVCASLKNNTGLNQGNKNDNCTDLDIANDCLIGNMEPEVGAYEVCDWKKFMPNFIHNVWEMNKAFICWMCGLQAKIAEALTAANNALTAANNALKLANDFKNKIDKLECKVEHLYDGQSLDIGEDSSNGSYVKPGGGVSFKFDSTTEGGRVSDVTATYIGGGLLRVQGSFRFFSANFTDKDGVARNGNSHWAETGTMASGGELICEIYVKKSQFGVKNIYAGFGQETGGFGYHINATVFSSGYAYGQHGSCNTTTGVGNTYTEGGQEKKYSDGHPVPDGYIIIQLRMSYIWALNHTGSARVSPRAFMGIRFNQDQIDC